ncbi:hypothetical protein WGV42_08590, partial [Campylobacter jejuni]
RLYQSRHPPFALSSLPFLPFIIDSKTHHFLVKVFMIRLLYLKTESIQTLNIKLNDLVSTKQ